MANSFSTNCNIASARTKILDVVAGPYSIKGLSMSAQAGDPTWEVYFDKLSLSDQPAMVAPTTTFATTGGLILKNTAINVRVTALFPDPQNRSQFLDGYLETPPSDGVNIKTSAATTDTNKLTVSWSAITNAVGYRVYAGQTPGQESLITTITSGATTSYVITSSPPDFAYQRCVTQPDLVLYGKKLGIDGIFLTGLVFFNNVKVFATTTAASNVGFLLICE